MRPCDGRFFEAKDHWEEYPTWVREALLLQLITKTYM